MFPQGETGRFRPPSDVIATDDRFIVRVEIAAMQADAFRLALLKRRLVVSGHRQLPGIEGASSYHQVEIETGEFRLEFQLPKPVNETEVSAEYDNGILNIELPYLQRRSVPVMTESRSKKD